MYHIDLWHLRTLVALRDTGSLIEAAERVHLTQSALSHQLKDMKGRLGCELFIRNQADAVYFDGAAAVAAG